jgi:hypothetical protein
VKSNIEEGSDYHQPLNQTTYGGGKFFTVMPPPHAHKDEQGTGDGK